MSTSATIIMQAENGMAKSIYLHHDGEVEHAGRLLVEYHNTPSNVRHLMLLGNLSRLAENGVCRAYHRDLREPWTPNAPRHYVNVPSAIRKADTDHVYVFHVEGYWTHTCFSVGGWQRLGEIPKQVDLEKADHIPWDDPIRYPAIEKQKATIEKAMAELNAAVRTIAAVRIREVPGDLRHDWRALKQSLSLSKSLMSDLEFEYVLGDDDE